MLKVLKSTLDASVNFISKSEIGYFESRYVRREPEYFICYLSSQSGCSRGCRFCHLTATQQTKYIDATHEDFILQAEKVFDHYYFEPKADFVHFNFMARGEPLANHNLLRSSSSVLGGLGALASRYKLPAKFNISTIMPRSLKEQSLTKIFDVITPKLFYSLYSLNNDFRRRWIPNALEPTAALALLKEYSNFTDKKVKIHFAFIEGQNDSLERDVKPLCDKVLSALPDAEFNLVRYNPPDSSSKESNADIIQQNMEYITSVFSSTVKIVPRVGTDVMASCGMFYSGEL